MDPGVQEPPRFSWLQYVRNLWIHNRPSILSINQSNQKLKYRHTLTITTTMVPGFYWIVKAFGFLRSPVFRHSLRGTRAHPLLGISVLASSQKEGKLMAANVQKGVIPVRQLYNKMNQHNQHDNDM